MSLPLHLPVATTSALLCRSIAMAARPAASQPALREGVAATLATRTTRATIMNTKNIGMLDMLDMLGMMMGMLPAKEAMSKVHTTNTDGKSTHDAHEDDSETCGAPLDAGACFCSNLLDFVSLHDSICIEHSCRATEDAPRPRTRTPARSHTPRSAAPLCCPFRHHLPVAQRVNACSSRAVDRGSRGHVRSGQREAMLHKRYHHICPRGPV